MPTISKFYLLDAATPNSGTMPTGAFIVANDATGDATGARTARDATDTPGASQVAVTFTANADQTNQGWGWRRFVSRPLAAQTIDMNTAWTHSYASSESNLNHNQKVELNIYCWRPSTGAQVGAGTQQVQGANITVANTQTANSTSTVIITGGTQAILDGDILVFEIWDNFVQSMSTAYTSTYDYNGTTEASTTSCASFVSPPAAITLQGGPVFNTPQGSLHDDPFSLQVISQAVNRAATW